MIKQNKRTNFLNNSLPERPSKQQFKICCRRWQRLCPRKCQDNQWQRNRRQPTIYFRKVSKQTANLQTAKKFSKWKGKNIKKWGGYYPPSPSPLSIIFFFFFFFFFLRIFFSLHWPSPSVWGGVKQTPWSTSVTRVTEGARSLWSKIRKSGIGVTFCRNWIILFYDALEESWYCANLFEYAFVCFLSILVWLELLATIETTFLNAGHFSPEGETLARAFLPGRKCPEGIIAWDKMPGEAKYWGGIFAHYTGFGSAKKSLGIKPTTSVAN